MDEEKDGNTKLLNQEIWADGTAVLNIRLTGCGKLDDAARTMMELEDNAGIIPNNIFWVDEEVLTLCPPDQELSEGSEATGLH